MQCIYPVILEKLKYENGYFFIDASMAQNQADSIEFSLEFPADNYDASISLPLELNWLETMMLEKQTNRSL